MVRHTRLRCLILATTGLAATLTAAAATEAGKSGNLIISSSTYVGNANTLKVGQPLPVAGGANAVADGSYPNVFNNDTVDGSFGITAPLELNAYLTTTGGAGGVVVGRLVGHLDVTAKTGVTHSFTSKSELSVNLSTDGHSLTLVGYPVPPNTLDVSNANTPNHIDPSNTDIQTPTDRAIVQVDLGGGITTTLTEGYTGDNSRAAILAKNVNGSGADEYLLAGNAGNGSGTPPTFVVNDTGVQTIAPGATNPASTVIGIEQGTPGSKDGNQFGFAVAQLGYPDDKSGKDNNYRSVAVFNNSVYVTKGSGGNGINTLYQVSVPGGGLPTAATGSQATFSIVPGFPTELAANLSESDPTHEFYPFAVFFANATTLYVADEGPGDLSVDPNAGLEKWIFNGTSWALAYTLQNGLHIDQTYQVLNYPAADAPATVGLRNLAGHVTGNTVTLFATTATYSNLADPGADPNQVVKIVDRLDATTLPAAEAFSNVAGPTYAKVFRGVAYAPCQQGNRCAAPFSGIK